MDSMRWSIISWSLVDGGAPAVASSLPSSLLLDEMILLLDRSSADDRLVAAAGRNVAAAGFNFVSHYLLVVNIIVDGSGLLIATHFFVGNHLFCPCYLAWSGNFI
jgi:hypothetical protein